MKKISIQIGSETTTAILLQEQAPNLCKAIWDVLPVETFAHHAKICNHELIIPMPLEGQAGWNENVKWPAASDVGWWRTRNSAIVWYAKTKPLGPSPVFAKIVENLEGFKKEALKTWIKQGTRIRFSRS